MLSTNHSAPHCAPLSKSSYHTRQWRYNSLMSVAVLKIPMTCLTLEITIGSYTISGKTIKYNLIKTRDKGILFHWPLAMLKSATTEQVKQCGHYRLATWRALWLQGKLWRRIIISVYHMAWQIQLKFGIEDAHNRWFPTLKWDFLGHIAS